MEVLLVYFLVINSLTFIIAGYDKYLALKHKYRIPENTLFTLAAIGGSPGLLLAMILFRHKISKASFIAKFSGILLIQVLILVFKWNYKF